MKNYQYSGVMGIARGTHYNGSWWTNVEKDLPLGQEYCAKKHALRDAAFRDLPLRR